jgi:hypothetical protein
VTEYVDTNRRQSFSDQTRQVPLMITTPPASTSSLSNVGKENDPTVDPELQSPSSTDDVYPGDHGDWRAIVCSIGVFFALFVGFGILNISGTFQTYWENNRLQEYSVSQIGWISSTQFFLTLFGSVFTGRWFDLHGGRVSLSTWIVLTIVEFIAWIYLFCSGFLYGQFVY